MSEEVSFKTLGSFSSCFKEKFGIPRQPGLAPSSFGSFFIPFSLLPFEAYRGLEKFEYLWLQFLFHQSCDQKKVVTVRPPRLGGDQRVGSLASRSPHRLNSLGLSCVKLEKIEQTQEKGQKGVKIHVSGHDLLEGTPILDIKPYIPAYDSRPEAHHGWVEKLEEETFFYVRFSPEAERILCEDGQVDLKNLIVEVLRLDPRSRLDSAQKEYSEKVSFAFQLADYDVVFEVRNGEIYVTSLKRLT